MRILWPGLTLSGSVIWGLAAKMAGTVVLYCRVLWYNRHLRLPAQNCVEGIIHMTLKVAIVGTGKVAVQNYLPYLVQHKDIALTYYNRSRDKAEAVAQQFGGSVADSLPALVADDPDTVLVLTRETDRYQVASELLALRPRRLFFEKPLVAQGGQAAVTEEDFALAHSLLAHAHSAGVETAMVFNYRFFEQTQKAHELVMTHDLGQPVHFTGMVHYACWSQIGRASCRERVSPRV